jgi:L-alanine-DL-glutamate epimerase-like enolase superfamily enzyme
VATPNLHRQECLHTWFPDMARIVRSIFDVRDGFVYPNDLPGLGIELDLEGVNVCRIDSIGRVAITDHLEGDLED